jgi:hypothetical protein
MELAAEPMAAIGCIHGFISRFEEAARRRLAWGRDFFFSHVAVHVNRGAQPRASWQRKRK